MMFMYESKILFTCQGCARLLKFLPPATKLGQGYIFTGVCHSVNRGECLLRGGAGPEGVSGPGGLPAPRGGLVETPPSGWPLLRAVRILLECLLVHNCLACLVFGRMC